MRGGLYDHPRPSLRIRARSQVIVCHANPSRPNPLSARPSPRPTLSAPSACRPPSCTPPSHSGDPEPTRSQGSVLDRPDARRLQGLRQPRGKHAASETFTCRPSIRPVLSFARPDPASKGQRPPGFLPLTHTVDLCRYNIAVLPHAAFKASSSPDDQLQVELHGPYTTILAHIRHDQE